MANIMRMATNIKDIANAHIVLIGNGDEFELVARAIKDQHLENVLLLPSVPQEEYFKILQEIDIGIFSLHPDHKTQNIPGKLLGYMVAGKAILGSVNAGNDILTIINQNHAGLVSINPDDQSFAANARRLIDDTDFRFFCGKNAKHLLYTYFNLEKMLNRFFLQFPIISPNRDLSLISDSSSFWMKTSYRQSFITGMGLFILFLLSFEIRYWAWYFEPVIARDGVFILN